jgi:hypothetical protein
LIMSLMMYIGQSWGVLESIWKLPIGDNIT